MQKTILISLIYLSSLALLISCSDKRFSQSSEQSKKNISYEFFTAACQKKLLGELNYSYEQFTERVTECNILNLKRLNREVKGKDRIVTVYLETKCGEISRMLSQYERDCKNGLRVSGL